MTARCGRARASLLSPRYASTIHNAHKADESCARYAHVFVCVVITYEYTALMHAQVERCGFQTKRVSHRSPPFVSHRTQDDDTYAPKPPIKIEQGALPAPMVEERKQEKLLMCGWRRDIRDILMLLDSLVIKGTEVHMISEVLLHRRDMLLREQGLDLASLTNIRLVHHVGNTSVRRHLEPLPITMYTCIMIMADESREGDMMHSDSQTLGELPYCSVFHCDTASDNDTMTVCVLDQM